MQGRWTRAAVVVETRTGDVINAKNRRVFKSGTMAVIDWIYPVIECGNSFLILVESLRSRWRALQRFPRLIFTLQRLRRRLQKLWFLQGLSVSFLFRGKPLYIEFPCSFVSEGFWRLLWFGNRSYLCKFLNRSPLSYPSDVSMKVSYFNFRAPRLDVMLFKNFNKPRLPIHPLTCFHVNDFFKQCKRHFLFSTHVLGT